MFRKNSTTRNFNNSESCRVLCTNEGIPIRSITIREYVSKYDEMNSYFSRYGRISSSLVNRHVPIIVFAEPESAARALLYRKHVVANKQFWIKEADDGSQVTAFDSPPMNRHSDTHPCSEPSKNGSNLLHLNDDCLYEILQYLPIVSLACAARTCYRLNNIATDLFATKHGSLTLGTTFRTDASRLDDVKMVLRNFGGMLTSFKISFAKFKFEECFQLLHFVANYCHSLEVIQIDHLCINRMNLPVIERICAPMKEIKLKNCKIYTYFDDNAISLFSKCRALRKLKIVDVQPIEYLDAGVDSLCNLESFTYKQRGAHTTSYSRFLIGIFEQGTKLRKLNLNGPFKIDGNEIALIAKNCGELEKLYINLKYVLPFKRIEKLYGLTKLKKLKINCYARSVSKFLSMLGSTDTLQYLELTNGRCDVQLFDSLRQFSKLTVLCLLEMKLLKPNFVDLCNMHKLTELTIKGNGLFDSDIVELVDGLPKLGILILIESNIILDAILYERIGSLCQSRQQKLVIHKCDDMRDEMATSVVSRRMDYLDVRLHPNRESGF